MRVWMVGVERRLLRRTANIIGESTLEAASLTARSALCTYFGAYTASTVAYQSVGTVEYSTPTAYPRMPCRYSHYHHISVLWCIIYIYIYTFERHHRRTREWKILWALSGAHVYINSIQCMAKEAQSKKKNKTHELEGEEGNMEKVKKWDINA